MNQAEIAAVFTKVGALQEGHFRYTSGLHGNLYMQCAQVLKHPEHTEVLCKELAENFADSKIDIVVGPAMGGIIVAYEIARQLGVPAVFTERENGAMTLRRGFELDPGQRVLVVEDVITTGGSVQEVLEIVKTKGAEPVGVGVLVNRSGGRADFGVPLAALLNLDLPTYDPENCPLCKQGLPLAKPGSRKV
jgi:orotate phosphoribosyltransferase